MLKGSLLSAMEVEHCHRPDSSTPFSTSNGIGGAVPSVEWEFVAKPDISQPDRYVERGGSFRQDHPSWCRKPEPLDVYEGKMQVVNGKLVKAGHSELIKEELVAGRLCASTHQPLVKPTFAPHARKPRESAQPQHTRERKPRESAAPARVVHTLRQCLACRQVHRASIREVQWRASLLCSPGC